MIGNGLQPGLWKNFRERFNIKYIREFYGSTEGNANMSKIQCVCVCNWGPTHHSIVH